LPFATLARRNLFQHKRFRRQIRCAIQFDWDFPSGHSFLGGRVVDDLGDDSALETDGELTLCCFF
jgi:hypothetical protein